MKVELLEQNLLPVYTVGIEEIRDGIFIKAPIYCKKKKNSICTKYYRSLFEDKEVGLSTCPYGFNSYLSNNDGVVEIFTGLRIKDKFNVKKVKPKIQKEDSNTIIEVEDLKKYIKFSIEKDKMMIEYKHLKDFIDNTFHDLRTINAHIKTKSDLICDKTRGKSNKHYSIIEDNAKNIWAMSEFVSNRLNSYDYLYYPSNVKSSLNTFKIFDKVRRCFFSECREKNININLKPNGECDYLTLYECFEQIPFQLVGNAVKYSLSNKNIDIYIDDNVDMQEITIKSISPIITDDEINMICTRGFRGSNAKILGVEGSGIGMYLVRSICDLHDIELGIESSRDIITTYNNIEYSIFKIKLIITK